jgi:general secretion pathway protein L
VIEHAVAFGTAIGLKPQMVVPPSPESDAVADASLVLWRVNNQTVAGTTGRRLRLGFDIAIVALSIAIYGLYLDRLDRQRADLQTRISEAKRAAAAVQETRRKIDETKETMAIFDTRREMASPRKILDELTRLVPTDSWVDRLAVRGQAVEIGGFSPHATELIPLIENSTVFEHPRFRSAITLAPDETRERFVLLLDIKPEQRR